MDIFSPMKCCYCGKQFASKWSMERHKDTKHKKNNYDPDDWQEDASVKSNESEQDHSDPETVKQNSNPETTEDDSDEDKNSNPETTEDDSDESETMSEHDDNDDDKEEEDQQDPSQAWRHILKKALAKLYNDDWPKSPKDFLKEPFFTELVETIREILTKMENDVKAIKNSAIYELINVTRDETEHTGRSMDLDTADEIAWNEHKYLFRKILKDNMTMIATFYDSDNNNDDDVVAETGHYRFSDV